MLYPAPLVAAVRSFFYLFHDSDKLHLVQTPDQQFSSLEVRHCSWGEVFIYIFFSAGTKCEVTVLFVCKLINFLASFSSNTRSSTLALSFNINCQLRGKVSSCRLKHSISYLSNNVVCSYWYSETNIVIVLLLTALWKFNPQK